MSAFLGAWGLGDGDWASCTVVSLEGRVKNQSCGQLISEKNGMSSRVSPDSHLLGPAMVAMVLPDRRHRDVPF